MYVVRPVEITDIPAFEAMAAGPTPGVHTLPRSRRSIAQAVECSVASFAANARRPGNESYLFVLESLAEGRIAGTAALSATAGAHGTYFAFRRDVLNQVSRDLGISHDVHALSLCSDLTAHSQLSGFYLCEPRTREAALLLSRARLMFAALLPHAFSERFFASMPGLTDAQGSSPFWEALGRKFFNMDFLAAERLVEGARNRSFIVELMPHYPVYVPLLPVSAQQAMGGVHAQGATAYDILREEGFEAEAYIDVFDGGAILQAQRKALNTILHAQTRPVLTQLRDEGEPGSCLLAGIGSHGFRATLASCRFSMQSEAVAVDDATLKALHLAPGDEQLCLRL